VAAWRGQRCVDWHPKRCAPNSIIGARLWQAALAHQRSAVNPDASELVSAAACSALQAPRYHSMCSNPSMRHFTENRGPGWPQAGEHNWPANADLTPTRRLSAQT